MCKSWWGKWDEMDTVVLMDRSQRHSPLPYSKLPEAFAHNLCPTAISLWTHLVGRQIFAWGVMKSNFAMLLVFDPCDFSSATIGVNFTDAALSRKLGAPGGFPLCDKQMGFQCISFAVNRKLSSAKHSGDKTKYCLRKFGNYSFRGW